MSQGIAAKNFVVRYVGTTAELDAIATDLLIMEHATDVGLPDDGARTPQEVAALTDDTTTVLAYMSVGSISLQRIYDDPASFGPHINANAVINQGAPLMIDGAVYLKFWEPALRPLYVTWISDLAKIGYDGTYVDVTDSWNVPEVLGNVPGATDAERAANAIEGFMQLIVDLAAAAHTLNPDFKIMLGHTPVLLANYTTYRTQAGGAPNVALIDSFKASVDAILVEGDPLEGDPTGSYAHALSDWAHETTKLALSYFPGLGDNDPAALAASQAFMAEVWKMGFVPYAAATDKQGFDKTYPVFGGVASEGPDVLFAPETGGVVQALGGDDRVYGSALSDTLFGGEGADTLWGGAGDDDLEGDAGDDLFLSDPGMDWFEGGAGFDTVSYAASTTGVSFTVDRFFGAVERAIDNAPRGDRAALRDLLLTIETFASAAYGDDGRSIEKFIGSAFNDIFGMNGEDNHVDGGAGDDLIFGQGGDDTLTGGAGADRFAYLGRDFGHDTITDFTPGEDKIDFSYAPSITARHVEMHQVEAGVVLSIGCATIMLLGVSLAELSPSDLLFS